MLAGNTTREIWTDECLSIKFTAGLANSRETSSKIIEDSAVVTSSKLIEDFSSHQELKIVNRIFEGLNEGIWPKSGLGQQRTVETCLLDRFGGNSTGLMRKCEVSSDVKRSLFSSEEKSVQQ
ncbi:pentatricopeptide repeat-containing protein-like [Dorcoceras hygrometricum]|uniref:Pentatricopeptide repeat-containing protein-like n=1 Tax=Dorcoceras hygrometricum TaxID=472368 RepID=A0A2Z7CBS2_9LAMI|nr:pentatricopeptide repeat-containing protein-like [Dorcoceras hygrometricum]